VPQVRKEDVEQAIESAALRLFAKQGFRATTVEQISRASRVATGNIYRYFKGKNEIFRRVVPPELAASLRELLSLRVHALHGVRDVRELGADAPYHALAERLLELAIRHRLAMVVLLGRAEGTRYAGLSDELADMLAKLALEHFRILEPGLLISALKRAMVFEIYRNFLRMLVHVLESQKAEADIRAAVAELTAYHLGGLKYMFLRHG
jgi:AcrR family transcriptional regulator